MVRPFRLPVVFLMVALLGTACGGSTATAPGPAPSMKARALTGPLTVFAAASLTETYKDAQAKLGTSDPGLSLTYSFAGSQALVQQIQQGAPADVFASADETNMQKLVDAGLVDQPKVFARNKLEIAVAPGNPKAINGLADLAKPGLKVTLEDASVPAGRYARQALTKAGSNVTPVSSPMDVKAALLTVTSGEADATVVYVTDVAASGGKAQAVTIPDDQNVIATYPIAVVKAAKNHEAAQAFVDYLVTGQGQRVLTAHGFLAP